MEKIRTLLVDDHQLFRKCIADLLKLQPDFDVVGEAGDGVEAIVKAHGLKPDLILMDVQMPGCDGVEATRQIMTELPQTRIVMLTSSMANDHLYGALNNGAQGYLLKPIPLLELLEHLYGAVRGEKVFSSEVRDLVRIISKHADRNLSQGAIAG